MNVNETKLRLQYLIEHIPAKITAIPVDDLSLRRAPGKWSRKEIMGHLCDSAINNLSRFIRAQIEPKPFSVNRYDQNDWVKAGHYQEMSIADILAFWKAANINIINVISFYTPELLACECFLDGGEFSSYVAEEKPGYTGPNGKRTLLWLIDDYAAHMEYHLKQITELI